MASFDYPKHKWKTLEFAHKYFWTQSSFWVKINFDPTVRGIIMHSLLNKCKKTHFLNEISSKNFKF
jgi:hypothetical protein